MAPPVPILPLLFVSFFILTGIVALSATLYWIFVLKQYTFKNIRTAVGEVMAILLFVFIGYSPLNLKINGEVVVAEVLGTCVGAEVEIKYYFHDQLYFKCVKLSESGRPSAGEKFYIIAYEDDAYGNFSEKYAVK